MRAESQRAAGIALILAALLLPPGFVHGFGFPIPPPVLDPKAYVSHSGRYTLLVDPSDMHGRGPATYRLSKDGHEVWSGEKPFSLWDARLTDEGVAAGYAYSEGLRGSRINGDFHVVILAQDGTVRLNQLTRREWSGFENAPPNPVSKGVVLDEANDRLLIRIADPDLNQNLEFWWSYRTSTGKQLTTVCPYQQMAQGPPRKSIIPEKSIDQVELVSKTPLTLLNWSCYDIEKLEERGAQIMLVDLDARPVWTLRLEKGGEIAACPRGGHFALIDRSTNQRIEFSTRRDVSGQYVITEIDRKPAPRPVAAEPSIAIPERPLRRLGLIELRTPARATPSPIQRVHDFAIDAHGRIAFVNQNAKTTSLELVDPSGETCGSLSLDAIKGGENSKLLFACVGGERFVLVNSTYKQGQHAAAAWWADFATGKTTAITGFDRSQVGYVAGFPDGRFVVGAWVCDDGITAFDTQGKRTWSQRSDPQANGRELMDESPKALTVTTTGEVVALANHSKCLYRFDQNGRHLGTLDLAKAWGREPNYPTGIEADKAGGFIISDFHGSPPVVRMNANGSVRAAFQPRHSDGRATGTDVKAAPDGRLWTCDGHALLRLDDSGVVDRVLGDAPDPERLGRIAALDFDPTGRIYAADARTGSVHVFDPRGQFLRTCVPSPIDFDGHLGDQQLTASEDGHVYLGLGHLGNNRVGQYLHFAPDGTRRGVETLALDSISEDWYLQPGTGNRWVVTYHKIFLVNRAGTILKTIERCPDRKWLEHPRRASVAPDGSLAVIARGAVNLYSAAGEPIRTIPTPPHLEISYAQIAFNGKWVAFASNKVIALLDSSGQKWQQFSPAESVRNAGCRLFFTPDGHELLLFDGETTIFRFELQEA
jgi:hypothetical protein